MTIMWQRRSSHNRLFDSKLRQNEFLEKNLGKSMTQNLSPIPSDPSWDFKTTTISHGELFEIVKPEEEEDGNTVMTEPTWLNIDGPKSVTGSMAGIVNDVIAQEEREEEEDEEVERADEDDEQQSWISEEADDVYDNGLLNIFNELNEESRSILLGLIDFLATAAEEKSTIDDIDFYNDESSVSSEYYSEEYEDEDYSEEDEDEEYDEGNPSVEITFDNNRYTVVSSREKENYFPLSTEQQPSFEVSNFLPYGDDEDTTIRMLIRRLFMRCNDDQIATIQDFIQRNLVNENSSSTRQIESIDSVKYVDNDDAMFDSWTQQNQQDQTNQAETSVSSSSTTTTENTETKQENGLHKNNKKKRKKRRYVTLYEH